MKPITGTVAIFLLLAFPAAAADLGDPALPVGTLFKVEIDKPGGLAFDGKLIWVSDRVAMQLRGLDPRSGRERAVLQAPGPWPTGLAFDGELLWVADRSRNRLFGIDLARSLVVRELESPERPLGLAFDGEHLWVADGKQIHQVTTEDGTTIVSHNAPTFGGEGRGGDQLGLAFGIDRLWVSDRTTDRLYRVDPETGEVEEIFPAAGAMPAGMVFMDDKLLTVDVETGEVDALDLASVPPTVRFDPKKEQVVLRHRITNGGPGTIEDLEIVMAVPRDYHNQALVAEPVFTPEPEGIVEDQWGQSFARFRVKDLGPGETFETSMSAEAVLYRVRHHINTSAVTGFDSLPDEVKPYLADGSKFAMDHPSIGKHLDAALDGETEPYRMLRKIARYIQDRMHYELVGGWNIAPTVIDRGSGSCSEYTFVFIAMCRKAGIPARYNGALVIRGDDGSTDEYFHRWPEVYIPGHGWIPFDVQAGDRPQPERQAEVFGGLGNRFLITTWGGGGSNRISWDYNTTARWTCRGRCDVTELKIGDWFPTGEQAANP